MGAKLFHHIEIATQQNDVSFKNKNLLVFNHGTGLNTNMNVIASNLMTKSEKPPGDIVKNPSNSK